jgi:hypothetical protein
LFFNVSAHLPTPTGFSDIIDLRVSAIIVVGRYQETIAKTILLNTQFPSSGVFLILNCRDFDKNDCKAIKFLLSVKFIMPI